MSFKISEFFKYLKSNGANGIIYVYNKPSGELLFTVDTVNKTIVSTATVTTPGGATAIAGFLHAAAATDILVDMADAAGANKVTFRDSAHVTQMELDSNGNLNLVGDYSSAAGDITLTAGNILVTAGTVTAGSGFSGDLTGDSAGKHVGNVDATAASDLVLTGVAGKAVAVKLGDALGVDDFEIRDSADAVVAGIDSDGKATFAAGVAITAGGMTATAGNIVATAGNITASAGRVTANSATGGCDTRLDDVNLGADQAPTGAQMIAAFGAAAAGLIGAVRFIRNTNAGVNKVYLCTCDGAKWHQVLMTAGA